MYSVDFTGPGGLSPPEYAPARNGESNYENSHFKARNQQDLQHFDKIIEFLQMNSTLNFFFIFVGKKINGK